MVRDHSDPCPEEPGLHVLHRPDDGVAFSLSGSPFSLSGAALFAQKGYRMLLASTCNKHAPIANSDASVVGIYSSPT